MNIKLQTIQSKTFAVFHHRAISEHSYKFFPLNMSTKLDLTEYKNIDQRTKDLVSGYIRNEERKLSINITSLINYICALFYFLNDEWNKIHTTPRYLISDDKVTIQNTMEDIISHRMAFLTKVARMGHHHWKFKINEWKKDYIIIGIVKYEKIFLLTRTSGRYDYLGVTPDVAYCLDINAAELNVHGVGNRWEKHDQYGVCKQGDIIDMYLDLDKLELSFAINSIYYGKAFDIDSRFGYVAAASFGNDRVKMTLLTYDCNPYQENK